MSKYESSKKCVFNTLTRCTLMEIDVTMTNPSLDLIYGKFMHRDPCGQNSGYAHGNTVKVWPLPHHSLSLSLSLFPLFLWPKDALQTLHYKDLTR